MDAQRLRNLTTGLLHTEMEHIYQDLEFITREGGIFTHMISRVMRAIKPWLREKVTDERFWDGKFDPDHTGDYPLDCMTEEENLEAMKRYAAMPDPLADKEVIIAVAQSD